MDVRVLGRVIRRRTALERLGRVNVLRVEKLKLLEVCARGGSKVSCKYRESLSLAQDTPG